MLDQDMDRFVEEQRAKLAEERRNLDLNPSSAVSAYYTNKNQRPSDQAPAEQNKAFVDNQPQYQQQPPANTRPETPKIFKLGEDYKKFRNTLNQQRQQEYLSRTQGGHQKGDYQQSQSQPRQAPQQTRPEYVKQSSDLGLSLPIRDHPSAKERLRQERNREYNEMLRRNRERGAKSYQPPAQPQQAGPPPPPQHQQHHQQQQRQPQSDPATTTAVVAPTRKRWDQHQPNSNNSNNNNSSALREAEEPSAGTRGVRARRRADDDGLDLLAAARREADEYMREKRRQLDAYNETLQKRLEADAYAAQKRQEADEYARNKIRDAETYQELLERKRLEERLYRGGAGEDLLPLRGPGGVEYVPVRRRRRRRSEYYDDDDDYDDDYYEVVDDRPSRRRRSNKPRIIRHVIDDDESSLATNDHVASVPVPSSRRDTGRSDQPQRAGDNRGGRSDGYGGGKPSSAEQQQDLSARGRKSNEYDTPAQVRSRSAPPEQENAFTGLPIGERENYDAAARKKEQYRRELEQQMREKQQQKKGDRARDRSEERSPARDDAYRQKRVTYADEQPQQGGISNIGHNIAPVGGRRRRSDSEGDVDNFRRRLPPKPILNNNNQQNTQPPLTYRAGPAPPQSSSQPEPISAHDQAYFYYGTRNPLDPTFPAGAAVPSSSGVATSYPPPQQPTSITNVRNVNTSPTRKSSDLVIKSLNGQTGLFVDDDAAAREKQEKLAAYQQELRRQVEEKRREKERNKEEQERYDLRKDREAREYNPWGKGGAGAPMRDVNGNLVSDLRQIRQNADAEPARKIVDHSIPAQPLQLSSPRYNDNSDPLGNTPRTFGRSNPFESKQTAQQKSQKDLYKEELQRQIDERKREEAVRKEKQRLEDEKEERRLEEQNKKMQQEFEEEQRKKQEKIEEQKRKNEELQRQIEDQKREEERKRREQLSNREDEIRRQKERELEDKLRQSQAVSVQQPQPTARTARRAVIAEGEKIPRTPVGPPQSNRPPPSNRNPPTNRNPPPSNRNQQPPESYRRKPPTQRGGEEKRASPRYIYSRDSSRISRELSALRRQLLDEQRRIENQLGSDDDALKLNSQILDLSRLRPQQRPVQVPVRPRPRPQVALDDPQRDHPDQMALKEFNDFKYKSDETASLRIFKSEYPEQPVDSTSLERQQAELIRNQVRNIESLKLSEPVVIQQQQPAAAPVVARQPQQPPANLQVNYPPPPRTANSLLETETTYIPISDDLPPTPQSQPRRGGARERRREVRDKENKSSPTPPSPSVRSMSITDVELLAGRNQKRLRNLDGTQQSTNTALPPDSISLNDPDEILKQFVNSRGAGDDAENILAVSGRSNKRSASVTTNESEPWLRPQSRN